MNQRFVLLFACLCIVTAAGTCLHAQQIPPAVVSDPAPDRDYPAVMEAPDVPSHGSKMYAVLYVASGPGPHPTVLLVQGFPGNEKNLDLAYSIRRAGWNVLAPFCRGSWGSEGTYSFTHAIEDAQSALEFLRDPDNARKYRIDAKRIVLVGHSLGGFVVSYVTAHDRSISGVAMISASNVGPSTLRALSRDPKEIQDRFRANSSRLHGTSGEALLEEAKQHSSNWNYLDYVPTLKDRPVLILEADDRNTADNHDLAEALKKAGSLQVTETHVATDHSFSDHRIALQAAVVEWLQAMEAQKSK